MKTHEGRILKDWMEAHRMSAKDLGELLGISDQAVYAQCRKDMVADSFKHKLTKAHLNIFKEEADTQQYVSDSVSQYTEKLTVRSGIPIFDVYGAAGKSSLVNTMENATILSYVSVPGYDDCLGWVRVKGDSMSPFLNSGDLIALKRVDLDMIMYGHVYFIEFGGEFPPEPVVKYIRKGRSVEFLTLRSHNDKYEDTEIPKKSVKSIYTVRGGVIEIQ